MGSFARDRNGAFLVCSQSIRFLKLPTFYASMIHSMRTMETLSSIVIIVISSDEERAAVCGKINSALSDEGKENKPSSELV